MTRFCGGEMCPTCPVARLDSRLGAIVTETAGVIVALHPEILSPEANMTKAYNAAVRDGETVLPRTGIFRGGLLSIAFQVIARQRTGECPIN